MPYQIDVEIDSSSPTVSQNSDYYKRFDLKKLSIERSLPGKLNDKPLNFKASDNQRILENHKPLYEVFDELFPVQKDAQCNQELCLEPYEMSVLSMCLRQVRFEQSTAISGDDEEQMARNRRRIIKRNIPIEGHQETHLCFSFYYAYAGTAFMIASTLFLVYAVIKKPPQ